MAGSRSPASASSTSGRRSSARREAARALTGSVNAPPLHERVRRLRVVVRLEDGLDGRADLDRPACGSPRRLPTMRTSPACGSSTSTTMYGPWPLSAGCTGCQTRSQRVDAARGGSTAAQPRSNERQRWQIHSGPHCQPRQLAAALHAQLAAPRALPVRRVEAVGLGHRARAGRRAGRTRVAHHSVVLRRRGCMLDTGVTIGPEMTIDDVARRAPGWSTRRGAGAPPRSAARGRACSTRRGCRRWC